jgi:hypothetical protein
MVLPAADRCPPQKGLPVARIRIDDLSVAQNLTPEQEALLLGAGLKYFRPSFDVLDGRAMPSAVAPMTQPVQFVQTHVRQQVVTAEQMQISAGKLQLDVEKAIGHQALPSASSPWDGVPAGSSRSLVFEPQKGLVAKTTNEVKLSLDQWLKNLANELAGQVKEYSVQVGKRVVANPAAVSEFGDRALLNPGG